MFTRGVCKPFVVLLVLFALRKCVALGEPIPAPPTPPNGGGCSPHYAFHHWTSADGLPASTIQCLLQTRDGYLWIGTRNGLVRFNGKEFRITPGMNCRSLAEDLDGVLWIGCSEGLVRWDGIDLQSYRNVDSEIPGRQREVLSLCSSGQGGVWVGWEAELWRARNRKLWKVTSFQDLNLDGLCESRAGKLYLACVDGVRVLEPTSPPGVSKPKMLCPGRYSKCVVDSPDGVLWFGSTGHACKVCPPEEGKVWEYPEPVGDLFGVAFDPRGTIWLGTQSGLWEAREQHLVRPEGIEGASFGVINCLLTDRDGNLWIGTEDKGLYCLYRKPFYTYTTQDGLASDDVWSITQARDESLWVATKAGASRLAGGQFATVRVSGHEDDGIWNDVRVITEDPAGTIWAGTGKGTLFVSRSELVTPEDGRLRFLFSSAYGNGHGAFWLVGDNGGMFSFEHGIWKGRIIDSPGTEVLHLLGIIQDSYGDLWVGSSEHGLFHLQKDRTTRVTQSDGLTSNMVGPVLADSDGTLWLASNKGLNRLKNGRITRYTTAEGLAEDIVLNVLEDGSGWFWLNGHRGIHRVRRQQLEDLAQGKLRLLDCVTYGLEDGLLSVEGNGGFFPNSCKTRDGRVWFPTTKGLAVVDPKLAALDALPPPVLVESLCADGQVVYDNGPGPLAATSAANLARDQNENQGPSTSRRAPDRRELRLLAGRADTLLFHLTANTLLRTEEVRFRYRLGGRDPQWTELGTQPSVLIPNLAPGHYRLQATACNSHSVWNHTGAEFGFYVAPFFHQTWTFYGLCAGTLLLGLGTFEAYRHRVQRRILALEKQAALGRERERIARDLHDDLGASLSRIARLSEVAAKELQNHPEAAPQLGRISSIASQVVDSISELVWATNPKYDNLESLAAYCREYAAQFFDSTGIDCRLNFPSDLPAQALTADFRRQLFLVFKEILHNVAKHAQAKTVVITLFMNHSELDLVIQDDGRGLPSDPIPKYHHGLTNMRERIAALRGAFEIHSEPGQGTRVSVRVPLPNGKSQDDNTR